MIWSELKRIFTKVPILVLFLVILPVFAVSSIIIGIKPPSPPPWLSADQLEAQIEADEIRLSNIESIIHYVGDGYDTDLFITFRNFTETWDPFIYHYHPSTPSGWTSLQNSLKDVVKAYTDFADLAGTSFGGASTVLITSGNYNTLQRGMQEFKRILVDPDFDFPCMTVWDEFVGIRVALQLTDSDANSILSILENTKSITFDEDQRIELELIHLNRVNQYLVTADSRERYADFLSVGCEYLELHIRLIQARNTNNITRFQGFASFSQSAARDRLAVLNVLITAQKASYEYSAPYRFGQVLHIETGTSGMDFVFNNLELISIPLILLACLIVVFCIFDDIKKNTILGSLVGPQSRRKVIAAKLFACTVAIALVIAIFAFLFFLTATIITGTATAPTILTAFGGVAVKMSPFILLFIYLISLFFKMLFFASITAFFCINAKSLKSVLITAASIIGVIIFSNALFSVIVPLVFYQYLPLLALDFAGFFGVGFMLSGHIASTFIWFTLPIMLVILGVIIGATIHRFNKRDF